MSNLLDEITALTDEVENVSDIVERTETLRKFGQWIQERHTESDIVCEINRYRELLQIDPHGTIIKADTLLQIRYTDLNRKKKS
jgi:hypothetical protein